MIGNNPNPIVIQDRDCQLLTELATMRFVDRKQASLAAGFRSRTRANARLLALTRVDLLRRFFAGTIKGGRRAIYSLSPKGAALARVPAPRSRTQPVLTIRDPFLTHQLNVNELYLTVKHRPKPQGLRVRFRSWKTFREPISDRIPLIPDGYCELVHTPVVSPFFVEVDQGTEALRIWERKIDLYLRLATSGEFARRFDQSRFRVLVLANSSKRVASIQQLIGRSTDKIFWLAPLTATQPNEFWHRVWLRPTGTSRVSLF